MRIESVFLTRSNNLALRMERRAEEVTRQFEIAERLNLANAKRIAVGYSSARAYNVSEGKRSRNYPYSVINPHPPLPSFMVNIQSGDFVKSWRTRFQWSGNVGISTLWNEAAQSQFFNGEATKRMIGRPILQEVMKTSKEDRRKSMREAVRKGLNVP